MATARQVLTSLDTTLNTTLSALLGTNGIKTKNRPHTTITVTPTITAGLYVLNDALGGLLTFANAALAAGYGGRITKVVVNDKDSLAVATDLVLYNATLTPQTDHAGFVPSAADLAKCIGVIPILALDFKTLGTAGKIATVLTNFPFYLASGTSLFGQLVTRGTPTYTTTSSVIVSITIEQD